MRTLTSVLVSLGMLIGMGTIPLWGHHSFTAEFDIKQPVTLKGTVTRVDWTNPHVWIHVEVTKSDGSVEAWMVEGGLPNQLFDRGIDRESLQPGMTVEIEGYRARDGSLRANGGDLTLPDGRILFLAFSPFRAKS